MSDPRGQLLRAAVGFATCSMPSYDRRTPRPPHVVGLVGRDWASGGRHGSPGLRPPLTRYDEKGRRATFYTTGMEHFAHERDRHRVGAHAMARDAAGGMGGA
jgi:hypothetical protein